MNLVEIIRKEKEFSKFKIELYCDPKKIYILTFSDKKNFFSEKFVGLMMGGVYDEFYTVDDILIDPEYQNKGYSKFMYKLALNLSKKNGFKGLMVGNGLLNETKSRETYKNFENYEYSFENPLQKKCIILTDWVHDKQEMK